MKLKVLHVISGLNVGGAEKSLLQLTRAMAPRGHEATVVSATPGGVMRHAFVDNDIAVHEADFARHPLRSYLDTKRTIRQYGPDLLHGWMYHGNLIASLCSGRLPVLWSIRHSAEQLAEEKTTTRWVMRAGGAPIYHPELIVFNSHAGAASHAGLGYNRHPSRVITNAVDTELFRPDAARRAAFRAELSIDANHFVIGFVGRLHETKDLPTFLEAAAIAARDSDALRFVMIGKGLEPTNPGINQIVRRLDLDNRVQLLGKRANLQHAYPGLDLLALTSTSEGTPNVLLEAMSCGVPCVATGVGDTALVLGERARVFPVGDARALAALFLREATNTDAARTRTGEDARRHVEINFQLDAVVDAYERAYSDILSS